MRWGREAPLPRTTYLLVHGRCQQMPLEQRGEKSRVDEYVKAKRNKWLAGLAKGLVLAGQPPIAEEDCIFPFFGNDFATAIETHEARGGARPDLETAGHAIISTKNQMVLEAAYQLGYDPERELSYQGESLAQEVANKIPEDPQLESAWDPLLKISVLRGALQFLARKTGAPEWIIEGYLRDVAYYLEVPAMRALVQEIVSRELSIADAERLVVIGHSLGSVVAYDLFTDLPEFPPVVLFVTAGSPLGMPIVQTNLRVPSGEGLSPPPVPRIQSSQNVKWINAYDVRDIVAIVHPIADRFQNGRLSIRDEITHNPSGAHSIEDYLADPDVAGPIGAARGS